MKKTYTKPHIVFESFVLSTNIAGDCEVKADTQLNFHSCGIDVPGVGILFAGSWTGCAKKPTTDDGNFNGYCYHVPDPSNNVFNS